MTHRNRINSDMCEAGGTPPVTERHRIVVVYAAGLKAYYTGRGKHDIGFRECWSGYADQAKLYTRIRTARNLARRIRVAEVKCCWGPDDEVVVETFNLVATI